MPEAIVAKCCAPNCNHYQLVVQRLPGKDDYFHCKKCNTQDGDQFRQPFRVATTPDGFALRSYDMDTMRFWAKKLNKQANGGKFDGMISWQKSRRADTRIPHRVAGTWETDLCARVAGSCTRLRRRR